MYLPREREVGKSIVPNPRFDQLICEDCRPWKLWEISGAIDKFVEDIGNVSWTHIYREANDLDRKSVV